MARTHRRGRDEAVRGACGVPHPDARRPAVGRAQCVRARCWLCGLTHVWSYVRLAGLDTLRPVDTEVGAGAARARGHDHEPEKAREPAGLAGSHPSPRSQKINQQTHFMPTSPTVIDDAEREVASQLQRRRAAAADAWNLSDEIVLVAAGEAVNLPGRGDITYPFRAHSEYFYLTDRERAGGVLAFDPREGWTDFVTPVGARERTWLGTPAPDPETRGTDELPGWLARRRACTVLGLGALPGGVVADPGRSAEVRAALNEVRLPKDAVEVRRMRVAARAMTAAFEAVTPLLRQGISERRVQIELEAEAYRCGADALAFDTVVGSGENAAALHGAPSGKGLAPGELVLIDAGCEFRGYASDITRTYGVRGLPTRAFRRGRGLDLPVSRRGASR